MSLGSYFFRFFQFGYRLSISVESDPFQLHAFRGTCKVVDERHLHRLSGLDTLAFSFFGKDDLEQNLDKVSLEEEVTLSLGQVSSSSMLKGVNHD